MPASVSPYTRARSFFFQAEDGRRGTSVTGVQTCALPISTKRLLAERAGAIVGKSTNRRDRTVANAVAETEEEVVDLTPYLEKEVTPTILDYHEFLESELDRKSVV